MLSGVNTQNPINESYREFSITKVPSQTLRLSSVPTLPTSVRLAESRSLNFPESYAMNGLEPKLRDERPGADFRKPALAG
jgi:hypothetical protein